MEVPELNLSECESVFVRDEFYENIQAPKFHDFCSSEDPVTDVDAYFRRLSGKSPRRSADPFGDQNAFKGTKETTVLKPPGLPKAPLSSMTLNADVTSAVPKASAAGLKKAKPAVPMLSPLTKSQEKAPSKNKMYQRMSPLSNGSMSSPASDGKVNDSEHAPSAANSHHASENTDPNGNSQGGLREGARRKVVNGGGSKSDGVSVLTVAEGGCTVRASIQNAGDLKATSENLGPAKSQSLIPKPPKGKSESTVKRVADPVVESSEPKDRKRKPILRTAEAGVSKANELKSRVLKQQRKSSTLSDSENCPGVSDLGTSSSNAARTTCSEPVPASSVKAAADRRTTRRSSDNSRRRRASGGPNPRQGRRALLTGPKSTPNAAPETSRDDETKVSLSSHMQFGSGHTSKQLSVTDEQKVVTNEVAQQGSSPAPALVSAGPIVTSTSRIHATECTSLNGEVNLSSNSGRVSYSEALSTNGASTPESVQTLPCIADESMVLNQDKDDCSVGDLLLGKLQNLQLQQDDSEASKEEVSKNVAEVLQPVSCENSSEDTPMDEEVKDWTGAQTNGLKENSEEITPSDNLNVPGAGVPTCTDLNLGKTEGVLDATAQFSVVEVIPGEAQDELDTTDASINLYTDVSKSNLCQATISGECMVVEIYADDVIESLQNLQIQQRAFSMSNVSETSGSQLLPCGEDTKGVSDGNSSLAAENRPNAKSCASADEELMLESHAGVPLMERKIAASCTQGLKSGKEIRSLKRLLSKGPSRVEHDTESDFSNSKGPHFFMDNHQKRNNKRKSIELGPHRTEQKIMTTSTTLHADEQRKANVTSQSSVAPLSHSQLSSSVARVAVPSGISGQHKKMKTTCPQPFRLRTEERGALKEVEFNKKVELYLSAKEKMQNGPFQFMTNKDARSTVKPPRIPCKETKTSVKQVLQHTQARAAERAQFNMQVTEKSIRADEEKLEKEKRMQQDAEDEIKRMRKQMVPHAQKMPFFDRPFKPHRSTKTLTVPSSPKFHLKSKKTCARTSTKE